MFRKLAILAFLLLVGCVQVEPGPLPNVSPYAFPTVSGGGGSVSVTPFAGASPYAFPSVSGSGTGTGTSPYAFPSVSAGGSGVGGGGGGGGGYGGAGVTPTPAIGGSLFFSGTGGDDEPAGFAPSMTSTGQVIFAVSAANELVAAEHVDVTLGGVDAYRKGSGLGWSVISRRVAPYRLDALGGKEYVFGRGLAGADSHDRLRLGLANVTFTVRGAQIPVLSPAKLLVRAPIMVGDGTTTYVGIKFDLNRSFTFLENGSVLFTPVFTLEVRKPVHLIELDDGHADVSGGELLLREFVVFDARGEAHYTVMGGTLAECTENCSAACSPQAARCFGNCLGRCMGVRPPSANQCTDGTSYGQCSAALPLYCDGGNYRSVCSACGCASGYDCQSDGTCRQAQIGGSQNVCGGSGCISGSAPISCDHGQYVADCVKCGCPSGTSCTDSGSCR